MRQGTQQSSSARGFDGIFEAVFPEPDFKNGKRIATGIDAVVAALDEIGVKKGSKLPQEFIEDLKRRADMADAELYEMPDGSHIIKGTTVKKAGSASDLFGGLDIDSFVNAMRYSDRHGGRSAFADFGTERFRRRGEEQARSPLGAFMKTVKRSTAEEASSVGTKKTDSPAYVIMLASAIACVELARYVRWQKEPEKAVVAADAFVKLIGETQAKDEVRFENLSSYLVPYAVNIADLVQELGRFSQGPRVDTADRLVGLLARLTPVLVNVHRDADEKAKQVSEAALAI